MYNSGSPSLMTIHSATIQNWQCWKNGPMTHTMAPWSCHQNLGAWKPSCTYEHCNFLHLLLSSFMPFWPPYTGLGPQKSQLIVTTSRLQLQPQPHHCCWERMPQAIHCAQAHHHHSTKPQLPSWAPIPPTLHSIASLAPHSPSPFSSYARQLLDSPGLLTKAASCRSPSQYPISQSLGASLSKSHIISATGPG